MPAACARSPGRNGTGAIGPPSTTTPRAPLTVTVCPLEQLSDDLVTQFAEGEGLLLTGAGVSRRQEVPPPPAVPRVRFGVPAAADLTAHFAERVPRPHPSAGTLEALATAYAVAHGDARLRRMLRRVYGAPGLRPTPFYDSIAELPPEVREFATTNYDPFLEGALADRRPVVVVVERGLERVATRRPVVYKVHGDAAAPDTCVITTGDYDRWEREAQQLQSKLATLFLERTVVAVGYGAQDGNLRRLLGAVNARVVARAGRPRRLYVVIPNAAPQEFLAYAGSEHEVVLVPATGEDFLRWLTERLAARRRAAAADAISALIDPPAVRAAQATVDATRPPQPVARTLADAAAEGSASAASLPEGEAWRAHAAALVTLAEAEAGAKRRHDAVATLVSASRAFALGGVPERAAAVLRDAYRRALLVQHDARLAEQLDHFRRFPVTGVVRLSAPADAAVVYYRALAEVLTGLPVDLPAEFAASSPPAEESEATAAAVASAAPSNTSAADASAPSPAGETRTSGGAADVGSAAYRAARMRAEHAVTHGDLGAAADQFQHAADVAVSAWHHTHALIRAAFYRGLAAGEGGRAPARAALEGLTVPAGAEELERARRSALGWLTALDGEWSEAAARFEEVAASALAVPDAVATANALRSAEWALRQRPNLESDVDWLLHGPGRRAWRIEQTVGRAPDAARASGPELRQEAERELRRRKTRQAWTAAAAAERLAHDDVDPGNLHRARMTLAEVWIQTLDEGGPHAADEFSVRNAVQYASLVHAELDDLDRETRAEVLRRTLGALADADVRRRALDDVRETPTSRAERVHATALLHDLAELLSADEVTRVALPMVLAGLADGWGRAAVTNAALAACRLFGEVEDRITSTDAAGVRDALAAMETTTPPANRSTLYVTLAQAVDRAGGAALADQLLGTLRALRALPSARMPHYRRELGVAMGALVGRTETAAGERLRAAVQEEAEQFGYRDGLAVVAARGQAVSTDVLDAYLAEIARRMRELARPAGPAGFGGGPADDGRLTQRASVDASPNARHAAIDAALALFAEDRQRDLLRVDWVECAVRLARGTPERLPEILSAFLRLGAGAYEPVEGDGFFSTHPLSFMREVAGLGRGLRAWALRGAGALWAWAAPADRPPIQHALEAGARDPNPHVRHGAAIALADVLHGLQRRDGATPEADRERHAPEAEPGSAPGLPLGVPSEQEDGRVETRWRALAPPWLLGALVPLLADPVPGVRRAARVAARLLFDAPRP